MSNSFGLIESKGLVALVEAADVILKNSPVEILGVHKLNNGLTALAVSGDQDYVNAAVESAVEAGKRVGEINAFTVIDQPPKQVVKIFGDLFLVSMENNDLISDSNDELNLKANRVSAPEFEKAKIGNNKVQVIKRRYALLGQNPHDGFRLGGHAHCQEEVNRHFAAGLITVVRVFQKGAVHDSLERR